MALRPLVRYPDPRLREPTRSVGAITDELRALVRDMIETMYAANGAGLAAIQVGAPLRLFIVEATAAGRGEAEPPVVFIDPEILWLSPEAESAEEGCLSFPGVYVPVKRALRARLRARDLEGRDFEAEGGGLFARAMQHEHDHLIGRLLIDMVGPLKRKSIQRKMERAAADGYDEAAER